MPFSWMKKDEKDGKDQIEINLPKETQDKLDSALSMGKEITELKTSVSSMVEFIENNRKEKEAAAAAAREAAQRKTKEDSDEELQTLILTDPAEAIRRGTQNQGAAILTLRADQVKRDVFEDVEKFRYYTGDIKGEVDKLLSVQNLAARNDPSVVENCYFTILGKHAEEAREGKLKSRFATSSGTRGTSSGDAGTGKDEDRNHLEINDDMRKAAKFAGMSPEDYAKMCYDQGVGYV